MKRISSLATLRFIPILILAVGLLPSYGQSPTPSLSSVVPASNTLVNTADNIVLTFTEAIDATSAANGITVYGDLTGGIVGTFTGGNTTTITFDPTNDFKPNEEITVVVLPTVTSTVGIPVSRSYTFQYRALSQSGPEVPDYFALETAPDVPGTFNNPVFVDAADIDKDGDMDMVVSNTVIDQVAWYENDGSYSFTEHILTNNADFSKEVKIADLDLDGDLDIVGVSEFDDIIRWYENDGSQNFTETSISIFTGGPEIEIADLDADGDLDVIASQSGIVFVENTGPPNFTNTIIAADGQNIRSLEVVDIDKDGYLDILAVSISPTPQIAWYKNDGSLNFTENIIDQDLNQELAYAADINGDGNMDVVASSVNGGYIRWFENDGTNTFTKIDLTPPGPSPREISPNDLDGDGDIDLIVGDLQFDFLIWLENDGTGVFTERFITTARDQPERVAVVDLDGDGDLDFFLGSIIDDKVGWITNTIIPVIEQEIAVFNGPDSSSPEVIDAQATVVDIGTTEKGLDLIYNMTIVNQGGSDLNISSVNVTGGEFSIVSFPTTLVGGASGVLQIKLSVATTGTFTSEVTIQSNDTDETNFSFFISGNVTAKQERIYWTDIGLNQINRSLLDGTGFEQYYTEPDLLQQGIDIDTANNLIYWANENGTILRAAPESTGFGLLENIIDESVTGASTYYGLAIDAINGFAYWVDTDQSVIKSADLNNANPTNTIIPIISGLTIPRTLDVDPYAGKIYYIQHNFILENPSRFEAFIWEANIDGSGAQEIFALADAAASFLFYDVKVDGLNGRLYWSGGDGNQNGFVYSADLSDVSGTATSFTTTGDVYSIDIDVARQEIYRLESQNEPLNEPLQLIKSNMDGTNPITLNDGLTNLATPFYLALDVSSPVCASPPPVVDSGSTANLCGGDVIILSGSISGAVSTGAWSTAGDGSFDDVTRLDATYAAGPGDIANGSVTLTLTSDDPDGPGPCLGASSELLLTITELATVTVPADFSICETEVIDLSATVVGIGQLTWTTSGDGSFDEVNILTPVYTPGANDVASGTVTLTATVDAGGCLSADQLTVLIFTQHTVNTGVDLAICTGDNANLSASIGGSASSAAWTTSGDGVFGDLNSLSTFYTPGSNDLSNGAVSLVLTTTPNTCESVSDTLVISIGQPVTASDQSVIANIGNPVLVDLTANAIFGSGDVLTASITSTVTKGTLEVLSATQVQYQANSGTVGADGFTFRLCNQCNLCSDATVNISIANVAPFVEIPQPPQANPGGVTTIDILSFVTDLNDNVDPASLRVVSQPISGASASFDTSGNLIIDYSGVSFSGTDRLSIEVCDLDGLCATQEIQIEVPDPAIVVYNAVSPNNDGKHDFLEIANAELFPNNRLVIMNRWGDIVFEITGYDNLSRVFEGEGNTSGAKDLPAGTYYYSFDPGDNGSVINGFFSLRK